MNPTIEQLWETLLRWLTLRPFGNAIAVYHLLLGLLVLYISMRLIRGAAFSKLDEHARSLKEVRCQSCGWSGQVQVIPRTCPQCNGHKIQRLQSKQP